MRNFRFRRPQTAPRAGRTRLHVELLENRTLMTVNLGVHATGLGFTGAVPPDTNGAVGPNHYVEAVNLTLGIYNKSTGALVQSKTLQSFFTSLGGILSMSDPVVVYDNLAGKFAVGVLDYSGNTVSRVDFAVSNTSDPTGAWTFKRFDTSHDNSGTAAFATDYPRLGFNSDAYVITLNQFPGSGGSLHVDTLSISKSTLAGTLYAWPTTMTTVPGLSPARIHDATPGSPMWLVGTGSSTQIKIFKMTNVLANPPTITAYTVTVPSYSNMPAPRQPGGSMSWTFDTRIFSASMMGGNLVAAHNIGASGGAKARWYEFNTSGASPTLTQSGNIDPGTTTDTYFPSIDINSAGSLGMTFIESSTTAGTGYMSMYVTGRTASDATGTMETPVVALQGTSSYTQSRAGDYSGTSLDPSDGTSFWAANEYKGASTWNTGIAGFTVGSGSVGQATHYSVTASTSSAAAGTPFTLTVKALDANNNVATGYRGTVHFTSNDPQGATLPNDYTFTAADSGTHTFTNAAALYTAGSRSVTATDTVTASITGSATVSVTPGAAASFTVTSTADGGTVAGNAFDVTVRAYDAYGNAATGYRGTVTFSSGDPYGASLPNNYTFSALDSGSHTFRGLTALYTAGTWDVTATDVSSGITGSDYIGVTAAPAVYFYVLAPSSVSSGAGFDVAIYALDPYNNIDTNYGGTVTWTTTDGAPGVVLPADYTFQPSDQGIVGYYSAQSNGFALITAGDQFITVTDTTSGITGSADVFVTSPSPGAGARHRANAALATALPAGTTALPAAPVSAARTLAVSGAAAGLAPKAQSPRQVLPTADGYGLVTGARADAAVLDLVLADWNERLNPVDNPV